MRADPALLANAVEESLRLEPAAADVDRYATRDVELGGARDPARRPRDASRSPARTATRPSFADPDRFDVRARTPAATSPSPHGPHVCLGMHLARLEAHTALGRVLSGCPACGSIPRRRPRRAASCSASRRRCNVVWG